MDSTSNWPSSASSITLHLAAAAAPASAAMQKGPAAGPWSANSGQSIMRLLADKAVKRSPGQPHPPVPLNTSCLTSGQRRRNTGHGSLGHRPLTTTTALLTALAVVLGPFGPSEATIDGGSSTRMTSLGHCGLPLISCDAHCSVTTVLCVLPSAFVLCDSDGHHWSLGSQWTLCGALWPLCQHHS